MRQYSGDGQPNDNFGAAKIIFGAANFGAAKQGIHTYLRTSGQI